MRVFKNQYSAIKYSVDYSNNTINIVELHNCLDPDLLYLFVKRFLFFSFTIWKITILPTIFNFAQVFFNGIGFKQNNSNQIELYESLLYDVQIKLEKWIRRKTASKRFFEVVDRIRKERKRARQIS